jgi:alpha-L-fucosidase 2
VELQLDRQHQHSDELLARRDHQSGRLPFVLDYLVEDASEVLVTCPSTSPENLFAVAGGQQAGISAAATMDIWLIRDLFSHCLAACEELGRDADFAAQLRDTLSRLREPRIAPDGRLQEWWEDFSEAEPGHRHLSHLFALYPGDQITPGGTPGLAQAARRSLEYRLAHGGGGTGWSRAWVVALWARLAEGDLAHHHLVELLTGSTAPNLFDLHPPDFFQIDGNLGATAAVAEMLVHSHGERIELLPALPRAWPDGQVTGLRARGRITVGLSWAGGRATQASLDLPTGATAVGAAPWARGDSVGSGNLCHGLHGPLYLAE